MTSELATASRHAAAQWAPGSGRLADLSGAAADLIGHRIAGRSSDEYWSAAAEVGDTIRACAVAATSFAPYMDVPALNSVLRLSTVLEQLVRRDRPIPGAGAWLERPLPGPTLGAGLRSDVASLTSTLVDALEREIDSGTLRLTSLLAVCAVGETCSKQTRTWIPAPAHGGSTAHVHPPATEAWRVLKNALIRFDDGSRFASRAPSTILQAALALSRQLEHLGPEPATPDRSRALTSAITQLPEIAQLTATGVERLVGEGRLFARARTLSSSEEHVGAVIRDQVVTVVPRDIGPVLMTARATVRLSAALALDLHRADRQPGPPHRPQTIAALRALARPDLHARDASWATEMAGRCTVVRPTPSARNVTRAL